MARALSSNARPKARSQAPNPLKSSGSSQSGRRDLLVLLHRASQSVERVFMGACDSDSGLTPRQSHVLATILDSERPSQTVIVRRTGIDRSTLADIMRRLAARKLVARRRVPTDTRRYELTVTPEGRAALKAASLVALKTDAKIASAMPAQQREQLETLLVQLTDALEEVASPSTNR